MDVVSLNSVVHDHTRLLLVEPMTLVRSCLEALLAELDDIELAGSVSTVDEGARLAEALQPDVVILAFTALVLTGFEGLRQLRERCPQTRLLMLGAGNAGQNIERALYVGADGYVNITATLEELGATIRLKTERRPGGRLLESTGVRDSYKSPEVAGKLTARESEVLKMVALGRTNKAIAACLCVSVKTVERHRSNVIKKLGRHNTAALTAYAIGTGLVKLDRTACYSDSVYSSCSPSADSPLAEH